MNFDQDKLAKRETLKMVHVYYEITDADVHKRLFELLKAVGGQALKDASEA